MERFPLATTPAPIAHLLDPRELRAWRGLLRVHTTLVKALDAELEAAHGLALTSYEVLLFLAEAPEGKMRMHDLAASVLLSRSGLTRLVDRLERDGLITRASCQSDARGAFAVITPAGRTLLEAARATHLDGVRTHFLDHLGGDELEALGDAWEKVVPGMGAAASSPPCG
jgi:DNA-binding MarR family transcriptional regulator